MRGVFSAAALATLLEYNLSNAFDHVVGSSAGAINGAYFMSGNKAAASIYEQDLTNKNFVNLLRRDKKVDVDYAIDTVMHLQRPLDLKKLNQFAAQFRIVLTDAQTGRKKIITDHHHFVQIYEELRATAALPLLYDRPVMIDGRAYIDGGVSDLIPLDVARQLGCTDIVVIMTQQIKNYRFDRRHERLVNHLTKRFARGYTPAVRRILPTNERALKATLLRLVGRHRRYRLYVLEPSDPEFLITMATIDKPKVAAFARLGVSDMDTFLHQPLA